MRTLIKKLLQDHFSFLLYLMNVWQAKKYGKTYGDKHRAAALSLSRQFAQVPFSELMLKENSKKGGEMGGDNAIIEINNFCNIDCIMCRTGLSKRKKGLMEDALVRQAVQKLKSFGIKNFSIHTIGDPLANPRLGEVLQIFREEKSRVSLSTNGLLLEKHLDTLWRYKDVCSALRFSIDGATREIYEKIRAGASWEGLHRNLQLARRKLLMRGYTVRIDMVLSRDNIFQVGEFIDHFRAYVIAPHLDLHFGFINSLCPDTSYFESVKLFGAHVHSHIPCFRVLTPIPYILIDGRVSICCRDYDASMVIGDMRTQSFEEIFNSSKALDRLRAAHLAGDVKKYPLCGNCRVVDRRIGEMFSHLMSLMLLNHPDAPASFYQERVDRFCSLFDKPGGTEEGMRALFDSL